MWCLWLPDCCSKEHSTEQLFYKICFSISLQIVHGTTTNRSSRSHALGLHLLLFYTWQITHFYQSVQMGWPPQDSPPGAMFFVVNLLRSQSPQRATRATPSVFILCCLRQCLRDWRAAPTIALFRTWMGEQLQSEALLPTLWFLSSNIFLLKNRLKLPQKHPERFLKDTTKVRYVIFPSNLRNRV